jgi:hypothetical protein
LDHDTHDIPEGVPAEERQRLMALPPEERRRIMDRRRRMMESMDGETAEHMRRHFAEMRQRAPAPEVGSAAPDFNLAVLDGDGDRVRLQDLRGQPVGLIFGPYT